MTRSWGSGSGLRGQGAEIPGGEAECICEPSRRWHFQVAKMLRQPLGAPLCAAQQEQITWRHGHSKSSNLATCWPFVHARMRCFGYPWARHTNRDAPSMLTTLSRAHSCRVFTKVWKLHSVLFDTAPHPPAVRLSLFGGRFQDTVSFLT